MAKWKVFLVHLRRPRKNDVRSDPFYEFGSFGCTRCHSNNLMHPKHADELRGARLAFIQGGQCGFRMVLLTPPIEEVVIRGNFCEARRPKKMPFKYCAAPIVTCNDGKTDFPKLKKYVSKANRSTIEAKFSSCFRSRAHALELALAREVIATYEKQRRNASRSAIASKYNEALPFVECVDTHRASTYRRLIRQLRSEAKDGTSCTITRTRKTQAQARSGLCGRPNPRRHLVKRCT